MVLLRTIFLLIIVAVRTQTQDHSVLIAIDISASTTLADTGRRIPKFVDEFIQSLPENVTFQVVAFDSNVRNITDWQKASHDNKSSVKGLLFLLQSGGHEDAVEPLISYIEKTAPTLAILFTDGHYSDLQSIDLMFDTLRKIREKGTVIIPVAIGDEPNRDFLEKISLVTQGALLSLSDEEQLKRDLIGFVLKILFPKFNLEKSKTVTVNSANLPGVLIFQPPCEEIKLIDPEFKILSSAEIESRRQQMDSVCVIVLDKPGSWRYYAERETIELDNLQLKASIPTVLLEGQVVSVNAVWENNGTRIALDKILEASKVEIVINQERVLGHPVVRETLKLDPMTGSFHTKFIAPKDGDYEVRLTGQLPFLTRQLALKLSVRGRIIELMEKEAVPRAVKNLPDKAGFFLKTRPGVKLTHVVIDGNLEVTELAPTVYFVAADSAKPNLRISGSASSARERVDFVYSFNISEDQIVHPPEKKKKLDLVSILIGMSSSILGAGGTFLLASRGKESQPIKIDDQILVRVEMLKSTIREASVRTDDELFEMALSLKAQGRGVDNQVAEDLNG